MSPRSFVETLDLADDERLLVPHDLAPPADDDPRRGGSKPAAAAPARTRRAAVNAGAVLSFVAGLSAGEMEDVLYSTQLAQRAASAQHDRFTATGDWYAVFTDILERLGWIGEAFAFTRRAKTAGDLRVDRSVLDVIQAIATQNQLAILVKTLDKLKRLADSSGEIRLLELQALRETSGNFQVGAVQKAENGALAMALGAFHFRAADTRRRVLFVQWGADEIEFWTAAQKLTLNAALYATHRDAVIRRLHAANASAYIADLPLD